MRSKLAAAVVALQLLTLMPASASHQVALRAQSTALAAPGMLVIDPTDGRVVIESEADSRRVPASVLKLLTATVALHQLGPSARFVTTIWGTAKPREFLIRGANDPFLTSTRSIASRYGHRYLPSLVTQANSSGYRRVKIFYQRLYPKDIYNLSLALRRSGIRSTFVRVNDARATELGVIELGTITSRPLSKMVSHTILWSDNLVADRLARLAARSLGMPTSPLGLTESYKAVLSVYGINTAGLRVRDGSGLSKKNRLSARTVVELLTRIRGEPAFKSIYDGLPIAGETGTLSNRFIKAPLAIGQVHAKTGWVNRSVTMAGYVRSGEKEFIFAILADGITPSLRARNSARRAIDKFLETLVKGDH